MQRQTGFTLVELVIVIVLLGIISTITVGFITSAVQGFADLKRREQLSSAARIAVNRIVTEVQNALPDSIRINPAGDCLEFIPILATSRYLNISVTPAPASSALSAIPFAITPAIGRIAVYPAISNKADEPGRTSNPVYDLDNLAIISPPIQSTANLQAATGEIKINLTAPHTFPLASPANRYFVVGEPVSFCLKGSDLYRIQAIQGTPYSFAINQPSKATLVGLAEPQRVLLATDIHKPSAGRLFTYSPASATSTNSSVSFDLLIQSDTNLSNPDAEAIRIQFEVQIANVI